MKTNFTTYSRLAKKRLQLFLVMLTLALLTPIWSCKKTDQEEPGPAPEEPGEMITDAEFSIRKNLSNELFSINSADLQKDGKLIVTGRLTNTSQSKVYRIDENGRLDKSFDIDKDVSWLVENFRDVKVLDNGRILVAGKFTVGGKERHLIRLNGDGSFDKTFDMPSFSESGLTSRAYLNSLYLQNDGKILVAGYFTSVNGKYKTGLVRLNQDASLDETFTFGPINSYSSVTHVQLMTGGQMFITGSFTTTAGSIRRYISKVTTNGSPDPGFIFREVLEGSPITAPSINTIAIQPDGKILIGGVFYSINNTEIRDGRYAYGGFARLLADGTPDLSFEKNNSSDHNWGTFNNIVSLPGGKILTGHETPLAGYAGLKDSYLNIMDRNGKFERSLKLGFLSGDVFEILKVSDKKYIVTGFFGKQYEEKTTPILILEIK